MTVKEFPITNKQDWLENRLLDVTSTEVSCLFNKNPFKIGRLAKERTKYSEIKNYPENTDGDTILFNEFFSKDKKPEKLTIAKRVEPKANRCVIFNGWRFHTSSNPIKNNRRIVLNTNFRIVNNG